MNEQITQDILGRVALLDTSNLYSLVESINAIREALHAISPFRQEPVDFVKWVKNTSVYANDYNPNSVAPQAAEFIRVAMECLPCEA